MRKETFEKFKKPVVYCKSCNRYIPTSMTSYSNLNNDGATKECNYCGWVRRNGGIPVIDGYSEETISWIIEYILRNKPAIVNDIASRIECDLDETIMIVDKIHMANRELIVNCHCDNCDKSFDMRLSAYKQNNNHFCSKDCYYAFKKRTAKKGKDNSQYKRIKTRCSNCNKAIEIIPYDYEKKNSFGDSNHFCSQKCYWDFRSKYYIGEKSHRYHVPLTEEQYDCVRRNLIKNLTNAKRLNTSIQDKVNHILDSLDIKYEREKVFDYYSIDNYLIDYNVAIEVMGDYWHSNPLIYNKENRLINDCQYRGIIKDKAKNTYLNNNGIRILYLWESDINKNPELCIALIQRCLANDWVIEDNNSYNWSIVDGELKTNKTIISPYFKRQNEDYKSILKTQNKTKSVTTTGGARQRAS